MGSDRVRSRRWELVQAPTSTATVDADAAMAYGLRECLRDATGFNTALGWSDCRLAVIPADRVHVAPLALVEIDGPSVVISRPQFFDGTMFA